MIQPPKMVERTDRPDWRQQLDYDIEHAWGQMTEANDFEAMYVFLHTVRGAHVMAVGEWSDETIEMVRAYGVDIDAIAIGIVASVFSATSLPDDHPDAKLEPTDRPDRVSVLLADLTYRKRGGGRIVVSRHQLMSDDVPPKLTPYDEEMESASEVLLFPIKPPAKLRIAAKLLVESMKRHPGFADMTGRTLH